MTEYYPLIARFIASLDERTEKSRGELYELARATLVRQLREFDPPFEEWHIERERQALEDAIRQVEADVARPSAMANGDAEQNRAPLRKPQIPHDVPAEPPCEVALPPEVRVVGVPGAFTTWGLGLVRQALESQDVTVVVDPTENSQAAGRASRSVRMVLVDALELYLDPEEPACTVVFLDDPLRMLASLLPAAEDTVAAIRSLTAALSRIAALNGKNETLLVDWVGAADRSTSLTAIAKHLFSRVPRRLPKPESVPAPQSLQLPLEVIEIARPVLEPMAQIIRGVASGPIVWPRASFYYGTGQALPAEIEVVGPARFLIYGPYFYLPPGNWRITACLWFSEYACTNSYIIDVFTDTQLAKLKLCLPDDGEWQVSFKFENTRWLQRVEVRLFLEQGAIEGRAGLRQLNLEPLC